MSAACCGGDVTELAPNSKNVEMTRMNQIRTHRDVNIWHVAAPHGFDHLTHWPEPASVGRRMCRHREFIGVRPIPRLGTR